ncbi:hypothetical protein BDA96_03G052100 [Sorghum bicolor]|uniref:Uncharacterized protein n=2 Tax=Sorghum bicolor TaxID=4558 RepID=A0A921R9D2_SORBI|nr:hypothetical protein BDA96_03G052100 [Sorghum bicolor]KXG31739.1 hypothetical protein SORBI_3003G048900 [Sorghum bicolor]
MTEGARGTQIVIEVRKLVTSSGRAITQTHAQSFHSRRSSSAGEWRDRGKKKMRPVVSLPPSSVWKLEEINPVRLPV